MFLDPTKEEMLEALQSFIDEDDNLLDIEAAIYWFASDYHSGQTSNLYSVLSTSAYTPSLLANSIDSESENCQILYDELVDQFME